MRIRNLTKNTLLSAQAVITKNFFARSKGLLGRKCLDQDEALVITHCQSIHMFFMKFAIDVIFVDKKYQVIGLVENIQPFSLSPFFLRAFFAIELAAGSIKKTRTSLCDVLFFEDS